MREYKLSTFTKILNSGLGLLTLVGSVVLVTGYEPWKGKGMLVVAGILFLVGIFILTTLKRKIVLDEDSISYTNFFSTKKILLTDIRGCRIGQKAATIEPLSATTSKIVFGIADFEKGEDLAEWLASNFKDVDAEDVALATHKLLSNSTFGATEDTRKEKLQQAKGIALAYNISGGVLTFLLIFVDRVVKV